MQDNNTFSIEMKIDNAAFGQGAVAEGEEIGRILKDIPSKIRNGECEGACVDINGKTVGHWDLVRLDPTRGQCEEGHDYY